MAPVHLRRRANGLDGSHPIRDAKRGPRVVRLAAVREVIAAEIALSRRAAVEARDPKGSRRRRSPPSRPERQQRDGIDGEDERLVDATGNHHRGGGGPAASGRRSRPRSRDAAASVGDLSCAPNTSQSEQNRREPGDAGTKRSSRTARLCGLSATRETPHGPGKSPLWIGGPNVQPPAIDQGARYLLIG